jgi:hypothetical protein
MYTKQFLKAVNSNFLLGENIDGYGLVITKKLMTSQDMIKVQFFGRRTYYYFEYNEQENSFSEVQ